MVRLGRKVRESHILFFTFLLVYWMLVWYTSIWPRVFNCIITCYLFLKALGFLIKMMPCGSVSAEAFHCLLLYSLRTRWTLTLFQTLSVVHYLLCIWQKFYDLNSLQRIHLLIWMRQGPSYSSYIHYFHLPYSVNQKLENFLLNLELSKY